MNRLVCPLLLAGLLAGGPIARGGDPPAKVTAVEGVTEYQLANGAPRPAGPGPVQAAPSPST